MTSRAPRPATRRVVAATGALAAASMLLAACGGGGSFGDDKPGDKPAAGGSINVLIGSSGDAETAAVKDAVAAWSKGSGVKAEVAVAADLPQQLSQGFAAGSPPDVFYVSTDAFAGYAANGSLEPYVDKMDADFYPTLLDSFTYDGTPYCAPKDFSTLALVINDDAWAAVGLTDDDYPQTWADLSAAAAELTKDGRVGLSFGPEWQRIGTFMAQAGGHMVDGQGKADVDSPENVAALDYVKGLLASGHAAYPSQVDAGWGGEAFGSGKAAMTIEGNWIAGAMKNDYPDVKYTVVPLPKGPAGEGTLQFTNCWGIAADSTNKDSAVDLVTFLTSDDQQMAFAQAFGVMPSVTTVADQWAKQFPEQAAFIKGADHAQGVPAIQGVADAIADFNAQLEGLSTSDPKSILSSVQSTLSTIAR